MTTESPDTAAMLRDIQAAWQEAQRRYWQGVQIVAESVAAPTGQTPKELVWALNKTKLYRYTPLPLAEGAVRHATPVLLVYALINKPYIFDLRPDNSFVRFMLSQGFDMYLLDWGAPGPEDKNIRFDDYATQYLPRAIRKLRRVSGAAEVSLLGYCIGATLTMLYAAVFPDAPIRNIVLLTAPIDFSAGDSTFATWLDERYFDVDTLVDTLGNIPKEMIETGANMLKPVDNYVGTYAGLLDRLDDPEAVANWQAFHKWVYDGVPFAGEAFRQWVTEYIRGNKLVNGRDYQVAGRPIDLRQVTAPLLNVLAERDHLVPPSHSVTLMEMIGSTDKQLEVISGGHVGIMASRGARYKLWPKIAAWLAARS